MLLIIVVKSDDLLQPVTAYSSGRVLGYSDGFSLKFWYLFIHLSVFDYLAFKYCL